MNKEEVLQHLKSRGMDVSLYSGLVVAEDTAAFPLYEFGGRYVGYQVYRPFADRNCKNVREARYFTYLPRGGVHGYFGLGSLARDGPVYLVEGVFKAAKLHRLGYASIALMGSETKQHMTQLRLMGRPYVGVGDPDSAGEKFARNLRGFTSPTDLDEMTDNDVRELLHGNY